MAILQVNIPYVRCFELLSTSLGLTGATVSVSLSKAGASFGAAQGTVAEIGKGFYKISLTTADVQTLGDLAYVCSAAGATSTFFVDQVSTNILNSFNLDASGNVSIASNIKKNQALNGFEFPMTSSATGAPTTGLTVSAQRSLNGAGFAPCANAVTELSNGIYAINLAATDLNANTVMLRFTASGANDQDILLITQP